MKLDIRLWLCWSIKETRTTATPWNWCCYAHVATGTVETELLLRSNNSLMLLMQERQKYACTVAFGIYIVTLCSLTHTHTHCHLVLWAWYITHTHTQLSSAEQRITAEWANLPLSPLSSLLSTQLPHYAVLLWDGEWQGAIYIHPYQSECPLNSVKSDKQCNKSSTCINNTGKSLFINIASALL